MTPGSRIAAGWRKRPRVGNDRGAGVAAHGRPGFGVSRKVSPFPPAIQWGAVGLLEAGVAFTMPGYAQDVGESYPTILPQVCFGHPRLWEALVCVMRYLPTADGQGRLTSLAPAKSQPALGLQAGACL